MPAKLAPGPKSRLDLATEHLAALQAHDRAFAFFKGACTRGIYDNLWTPPAAR